MSTYLETHPPKIRQFRSPRRAKPSGLIVIHTAESVMDTVGPDTGAENVAAWIVDRDTYGSYHIIVDSDSRLRLVPFDAEAYGDGTGSNPFAIHISFACAAADWPRMTAEKRLAFIRNGAQAAHEAAEWLKNVHGIEVPPARVTRAESEAREPGFISHGERDPGRRSDPGAAFPWSVFMREFVAAGEAEERARRRARLTTRIAEKVAKKARLRARLDRVNATIKRLRTRRDTLR